MVEHQWLTKRPVHLSVRVSVCPRTILTMRAQQRIMVGTNGGKLSVLIVCFVQEIWRKTTACTAVPRVCEHSGFFLGGLTRYSALLEIRVVTVGGSKPLFSEAPSFLASVYSAHVWIYIYTSIFYTYHLLRLTRIPTFYLLPE